MELRDFAEQILRSDSLDVKLADPGQITDERPGSPLCTPDNPGRPLRLRFKATRSGKSELPGAAQLETPRHRGRLLHFFANHELLATELMALAILKFPEAPASFRRGLLQTLRDEQEHTRWYLKRLQECGLEFGDHPVSGFIWKTVSSMENPLDYVARLSLTFEQSNLDFASHYAEVFQTLGDLDSAALLQRIYRDEIRHVAYGLQWFRRWKHPAQSDWDAFCRALDFPLTPQRAKGFSLNVEGRRQAGFDESFIESLKAHSRSKGRTPEVLYFNPYAEEAIANPDSFTLNPSQVERLRDLDCLPMAAARTDDVVLVRQRPGIGHLNRLKESGLIVPEFVEIQEDPGTPIPGLSGRKLKGLRPWAWAPDSIRRLHPLFPLVTGSQRPPTQCFNEAVEERFNKVWSCEFLRNLLEDPQLSEILWLCPRWVVGQPTNSLEALWRRVQEIRAGGHHRVVIKKPLGAAGRQAIRLWEPEPTPQQVRWIERAIAGAGSVIVEPWLERCLDFSIQWDMTESGLKLRGFTRLINDRRGQFIANQAEPNIHRPPTLLFNQLRAAHAGPVVDDWRSILAVLQRRLGEGFSEIGFLGPIGVDAFLYLDAQGKPLLKPVVEINPRQTMGRWTLELMRQTAPGSHGLLRLVNRASLRSAGIPSFTAYAAEWSRRHPITRVGKPNPRIRSGSICLNDPESARSCLAVFQVFPESISVNRYGEPIESQSGFPLFPGSQ